MKFRVKRKEKWSYNTGKFSAIYHPCFYVQMKLFLFWITIKVYENPHDSNESKEKAYECLKMLERNDVVKFVKGK